MEQKKRRAVLMCAGDYEPMGVPHGEKDFVVAVDGGLRRLLDQEIEPDLVLGDFDSIPESCRPYLSMLEEKCPEKLLRLPCEKDDTDTIYAARVCLERGIRELLFYGALGGRLDHTMANIQTLAWMKERGADGALIGKNLFVTVLEGEKVLLPDGFAGTFSLFALDPKVTGVTITGMKYPLSGAELINTFPLGVSNEVYAPKHTGSGADAQIHPVGEENAQKRAGGEARTQQRAEVEIRTGKALMILNGKVSESLRAGTGGTLWIERMPLQG